MQKVERAGEPTMEEILASIRQIIAEEPVDGRAAPPLPPRGSDIPAAPKPKAAAGASHVGPTPPTAAKPSLDSGLPGTLGRLAADLPAGLQPKLETKPISPPPAPSAPPPSGGAAKADLGLFVPRRSDEAGLAKPATGEPVAKPAAAAMPPMPPVPAGPSFMPQPLSRLFGEPGGPGGRGEPAAGQPAPASRPIPNSPIPNATMPSPATASAAEAQKPVPRPAASTSAPPASAPPQGSSGFAPPPAASAPSVVPPATAPAPSTGLPGMPQAFARPPVDKPASPNTAGGGPTALSGAPSVMPADAPKSAPASPAQAKAPETPAAKAAPAVAPPVVAPAQAKPAAAAPIPASPPPAAPSAVVPLNASSDRKPVAIPASTPVTPMASGGPLADLLPSGGSVRTLEDTVVELLRPMLRNWLDENMPRIVEKALRVELAEQLKRTAPPKQS